MRLKMLGRAMVLMFILGMIQGCSAPKTATVHPTLKGDNATLPAMPGEVELPDSGFVTLADLTNRFAKDLSAAIPGQKLYLDRANIRDATTGDVANFSIYLENELDAALSGHFQLVNDPAEAEYLVGAVFQGYGNSIRIFFKYHDRQMTERKSLDYSIERHRLPADSLKENMRSKAYQLAVNIIPPMAEAQLYINPVLLDSCACVTDFARSLTAILRTEIVRLHPDVTVCADPPLAPSAVRGISLKAREVQDLDAGHALFAGADTVLEGDYFVNGDLVMVNLMLKDLQGRIINTAEVDIDRRLITARLDNPPAEKLADLADKKSEENGNAIEITTTRGSADPVYREGEKITFLLQARQPLYLYIYNITSRGEVALLYPYQAGSAEAPLLPGVIQAIPAESDPFELEVTPPFGLDIVKVFASPVRLPLPTLNRAVPSRSYTDGVRAIARKRKELQEGVSREKSINPDDLVDYYRGLAGRLQKSLFEDSLLVETRK